MRRPTSDDGVGLNSTSPSPSIQPAISALEEMYGQLLPTFIAVAHLEGEVPPPTIVVQRRGRRKVHGWMAPRTWTCGQATLNEITLSAETLGRGAAAALETLTHEMVHHVNSLRGVADCSANGYHTRKFKFLAEQVGLIVEKDGWRGFCRTALGPTLQPMGARLSDHAFAIFRTAPPDRRPGSRMKKWQCACRRIFRAAVEHHAYCLDCGSEYQRVE